MNWSEYSTLKSGSKVSFAADKQTTKEAVSEVTDSDGKVVRAAEAKEEREFVVLAQKSWDSQTGEALPDSKREYTLSDLEREKARFDSEIARLQAQSDGVKAAIVDFNRFQKTINKQEKTMAKKQKEEPMVSIDGKEYKVSDLEPEQVDMVNHVADLSNKLRSAQFNVVQLQGGHKFFMDMLNESLEEDKPEANGKPEAN